MVLGSSSLPPGDKVENVRSYTRKIEFDYVSWTLTALAGKVSQYALGDVRYLPLENRRKIVLDYLELARKIQQGEVRLIEIFADPNIADPQEASAPLRDELDDYYRQRDRIAPVAEAVIQSQISTILAGLGLTVGNQPVPPVLFRSSPVPLSLVVSPRDAIRQDAQISLDPNLSIEQRDQLEVQVDQSLNVSSLVVPIGGIGIYPTMVMETNDLNWLSEVVSHEWVHNFLTLRPLGLNYMTSPELRTMNETAASIAGKEIGRAVIEAYYPELAPPPPTIQPSTPVEPAEPAQEPVFKFNNEMRQTRVNVDQLLAEGKVEEAEAYMEARRVILWEHGYHIRKLNQAYFAFYGAYADQPGGAAGEDPVGAAVRALRARSPSLADFLKRIAWMSTFDQLKQAVGG